jgi:hypothetical protein
VVDLSGGPVTSVRIDFKHCDRLNDLYVVRAPGGVIQLEFEKVEEAVDEDQPLAAEFVTQGRYVACGDRRALATDRSAPSRRARCPRPRRRLANVSHPPTLYTAAPNWAPGDT